MSATKDYYFSLLEIAPEITDDDGFTHPDLLARDARINALPQAAATRAIKLVQAGWDGTFKELLAHVRATSGTAATWLSDHPDQRPPGAAHPRTPEAAETSTARWWRDGCVTLGTAPLTWGVLNRALTGPYELGSLGEHPLALPYAGANGLRHFHPSCVPGGPTRSAYSPSPKITHTTLAALHADLVPSLLHQCSREVNLWLPAPLQAEAGMLGDAAVLTCGWRGAQQQSALHGRPIMPEDATPLTSGLLTQLASAARTYVDAHPDRAHIGALADDLEQVVATWSALADRAGEVAADDPHQATLAWASEHRLPDLSGSERQVRWAEKIRYELCADQGAAAMQVAARETSAGVWIGLHQQRPRDLLSGWLDMRDRDTSRASRDQDRERLTSHW